MAEQTKLVNIFNQKERKIVCIANEHDYLGDGTMFKEEKLEVGKEYTFIGGEAQSYGLMVHLKEVEEVNNYGFQSYLFEEIEPYDKEEFCTLYRDWLFAELEKGRESAENGKVYTANEMKAHFDILRNRINKWKHRRTK